MQKHTSLESWKGATGTWIMLKLLFFPLLFFFYNLFCLSSKNYHKSYSCDSTTQILLKRFDLKLKLSGGMICFFYFFLFSIFSSSDFLFKTLSLSFAVFLLESFVCPVRIQIIFPWLNYSDLLKRFDLKLKLSGRMIYFICYNRIFDSENY